jgi:hypothetical protein
MIRRSSAWIAIAAALPLTGVAAVAPMASASTKPTASLTFSPNKVTAKADLEVKYTSAHVPAGSTLYLQWQVGSAHVWKRYATLKGTSGTASERGVPQGRDEFRIHVATKKKAVTTSRQRALYSYANVPMLTICKVAWTTKPCQTGTDDSFTYVLAAGGIKIHGQRLFAPRNLA